MSELRTEIENIIGCDTCDPKKAADAILALVDAERPSGLVVKKECPICKGTTFKFPQGASFEKCNHCSGTGTITCELSRDEVIEWAKMCANHVHKNWLPLLPSGEKVSLKS